MTENTGTVELSVQRSLDSKLPNTATEKRREHRLGRGGEGRGACAKMNEHYSDAQ
jgi:hypothetical protein